MKQILIGSLLLSAVGICGCQSEVQPLTGSKWGEVPNGSAESVVSNKVVGWSSEERASAQQFYDAVSHSGTKSLVIYSATPANGNWSNTVNLKPWSKYRFSIWVKTDNVQANERGAVRAALGVGKEYFATSSLTGTHDWTQLNLDFETGANDCATITCSFGPQATGKAWFDDASFELITSENYSTSISIDPNVQGTPMSEYIYGQFTEHMGKCIYGGIWAEMLMDRKFCYAPNDRNSSWRVINDVPRAEGRRGEGFRPNRQREQNNLFEVDSKNAYVGEHSVLLKADNNKVALEQSGLGVRADMDYSGYVILKADRKMDVTVTLKVNDFKTSKSVAVGTTWEKIPLAFDKFPAKDGNATFSIAPESNGKLWVGTASLMPNDNVEGFRADVLELLKGLNSPVYRWPGGNFVSGYDWHDGIGPRDQRPPRRNPAWTGVESNDVGIHEFMQLCKLLNTEPYIAVNAGLGNMKQAADEVEYANGDQNTPMGKLRAKNGHSEPWNVKWWSVGNEMFGDWQLGFMATDAFAARHNDFAKAMWTVDSTIKLIGVGEVGNWDKYILANCSDYMNLVSEHFYCQDWHGGGLMTHVLQIPREIKRIADAHREYRRTIPALEGKDIRICMDEWNYWYGPHIYGELGTRYYLRDALGIAAGLNEFMRQSDIVFMANYAQTVNVIGAIKATTTDADYASTGQVLKLYREVFGTIPVQMTGETRPFDVAAAINKDKKTLTISVVNPTWDVQTFPVKYVASVELDGVKYSLKKSGTLYTLTGDDDMVYNTPGEDAKVIVSSESLNSTDVVTIMPYSANIIEIPFN